MKLTLGPILGNWSTERWRDFYARIADEAPLDRVVIGEVVCSKRLPFYADEIVIAAERLARSGKQVAFASLALVTLERERRLSAELAAMDALIEVNDLTLLHHLPPGRRFIVSPLVNVYNEGTLAFLAGRGAINVCLPPELPLASIEVLAGTGRRLGIETEVWAYGRVPLAISGRCYHARVHGLAKDSCQFVCAADPDGMKVDTLDGEAFLAVNGVQTLSYTCVNALGEAPALATAGISHLRLSPQTCDMAEVARIFRCTLDGELDPRAARGRLAAMTPDIPFSNGFMVGGFGAEYLP